MTCLSYKIGVKLYGGQGSLALGWQTLGEKENSEYKPVKLLIKNKILADPAGAEGLLNTYKSRAK